MTSHKFAVGDRVSFRPGRFDGHAPAGIYTIVRILPVTSAGCQYRVRNALNNQERVFDEVQLSAT